MHSRIIEIRNGRPFSAEEIKNGVMNVGEIYSRHENEWWDYIRASDDDREEDLDWFVSRLVDVFTREGNELTLSQEDYDAFVESYIRQIRDLADEITPEEFYPNQQFMLSRLASMETDFCDFRVYVEDDGEVISFADWLMSTSTYHDENGEGRKFYIGKVWDYHL